MFQRSGNHAAGGGDAALQGLHRGQAQGERSADEPRPATGLLRCDAGGGPPSLPDSRLGCCVRDLLRRTRALARTPLLPLRSWWKEERRSLASWRSLRGVVGLLLLGLIPLAVLEVQRRSLALAERQRNEHAEATAIVVASLASLRRTAQDWAHWDEMNDFVSGRRPQFIATDIATTSLFDDGGVMVLLDSRDQPLLVFSRQGRNRPGDLDLLDCVRRNRRHLGPAVDSTLRLACTNGQGQWLLGVGTHISNSDSTAPVNGVLVMFEPLLRQEYGRTINIRLMALGRQLLPASSGQLQRLEPSLFGPAGEAVAVAGASTQGALLASLAEDALRLLALGLLILGVRMLLLLGARRQRLARRRLERQSNHRIRYASRELDRLLSRMGMDPAAPQADQRVMARLLEAGLPAPGEGTRGIERKLEQLADRLQRFLHGARSLALFDPLTQLPNRRYFIVHLELQAEQAGNSACRFVILFIDVDRFKSINDTYGHAIGDALLVVVSDRLREQMRKTDFLARYGGDEFALLVEQTGVNPTDNAGIRAAAYSLASRIASAFEVPVRLPGVELELSISIGIDLELLQPGKAEETMKRCDLAMSRAKQYKHTRIAVFDVADRALPTDNYRLYVDLVQAIRDHAIDVHFQPIVTVDGRILGVEALARWDHPELGPMSPELFIDLAERHRQMVMLGGELLRVSLQRFAELQMGLARLRGQGRADPGDQQPLSLSLNLSPSMLADPELVDRLQGLMSLHPIDPRCLTIELTERSVIDPGSHTTANLRSLRGMGMSLSLDDFGTGYSSLNLLTTFHPDEVKIDKSFVMAMVSDQLSRQIVTMVAGMAPSMGLEIVAEGVDNTASLSALSNLGIRRFQGYLFARPLPVAELLSRCMFTEEGVHLILDHPLDRAVQTAGS